VGSLGAVFTASSGGGGVLDFGGAEAGAASGSSGVPEGGKTIPTAAEVSGALVAGAGDGTSTTVAGCPGRARRVAFPASGIAFMYRSAALISIASTKKT
jgi:hypothetical protein